MHFTFDTGSFANMISTRAARTVTKVSSDESIKIKGLSGEVNQTYSADKATLRFANIQQPNQDYGRHRLFGDQQGSGNRSVGISGLFHLPDP
jgi:hypothetical protein